MDSHDPHAYSPTYTKLDMLVKAAQTSTGGTDTHDTARICSYRKRVRSAHPERRPSAWNPVAKLLRDCCTERGLGHCRPESNRASPEPGTCSINSPSRCLRDESPEPCPCFPGAANGRP